MLADDTGAFRPALPFLTKLIERFMVRIPKVWKDGYDNVTVGCTVENQDRADYRLSILQSADAPFLVTVFVYYLSITCILRGKI